MLIGAAAGALAAHKVLERRSVPAIRHDPRDLVEKCSRATQELEKRMKAS